MIVSHFTGFSATHDAPGFNLKLAASPSPILCFSRVAGFSHCFLRREKHEARNMSTTPISLRLSLARGVSRRNRWNLELLMITIKFFNSLCNESQKVNVCEVVKIILFTPVIRDKN